MIKIGTTKKKTIELSPESRRPIAEVRENYQKALNEIDWYKNAMRCPACGKFKVMSNINFYTNTDPIMETGLSAICKDCVKKIARRIDNDGNEHGATKSSILKALQYINKPFINKVWDSSCLETEKGKNNPSKAPTDIWGNYIKNIQMKQYINSRWEDGDVFFGNESFEMQRTFGEQKQLDQDEMTESESNRAYIINNIGYDPFEDYPRHEEKPKLYNKLVSFMDEDAKDDPMKMMAIIEIVKTYNQIEKINQSIDAYTSDPISFAKNIAVVDKLSATKDKLNRSAIALAKDNGISVNNNNNKSKGANTLAGKIKMLKSIGFREAEINAFDYETCEGMRQVAELSEAARHKQIGYDENIAHEIKDIKVELVESLTKERDAALESMRLLLVENNDLKKTLHDLKEKQYGV